MAIVRIMRLDGDPDELAGKYQRVQEALRASGIPFPAEGMRVHIAAKTADGFRVANVWDSGSRRMPPSPARSSRKRFARQASRRRR